MAMKFSYGKFRPVPLATSVSFSTFKHAMLLLWIFLGKFSKGSKLSSLSLEIAMSPVDLPKTTNDSSLFAPSPSLQSDDSDLVFVKTLGVEPVRTDRPVRSIVLSTYR